MIRKLIATDNDGATAILRLLLGVTFFAHGAQKMLGWFGGYGFTGTMGFFTGVMHIPAVFAFLAIAAEFFGGLGLIFGLLTRVAAFGISCNTIVAASVVLMIRGAGAASVDRLLFFPTNNKARLHAHAQAA